jgi:hypothetical protein
MRKKEPRIGKSGDGSSVYAPPQRQFNLIAARGCFRALQRVMEFSECFALKPECLSQQPGMIEALLFLRAHPCTMTVLDILIWISRSKVLFFFSPLGCGLACKEISRFFACKCQVPRRPHRAEVTDYKLNKTHARLQVISAGLL